MASTWLRDLRLILVWLAVLCAPAAAQISPDFANSKVAYSYVAPKSLKYIALYERVQKFKVLEQLAEFLAPLRLPHIYTLVTLECGAVNAYYVPSQWRIHLCYEYIEMLEHIAPKKGQASEFTYEEAVVGAFVAVVLHETGHAVFDMLDVPVFGREEDAADEMSTFLALQFNPEVALKVVRGRAYMQKTNMSTYAPLYSDEHGTQLQRYYNTICIAYGSEHSSLFKDFAEKSGLPKARAETCPREYDQIKRAFKETVLPFIDQELMKKVQARQWLRLTPEQAALLDQQQSAQTDSFSMALCNRSAVTKVHVALAAELVEAPGTMQALGWFQIPDGACELVGTFRGDRVYWYAEGVNNNKPAIWSAAENDATGLRQCIDPVNSFQSPASERCQSGQKVVKFRRWNVDPSLFNVTITLR
jgi:hypothetical protein